MFREELKELLSISLTIYKDSNCVLIRDLITSSLFKLGYVSPVIQTFRIFVDDLIQESKNCISKSMIFRNFEFNFSREPT